MLMDHRMNTLTLNNKLRGLITDYKAWIQGWIHLTATSFSHENLTWRQQVNLASLTVN